MKHHYVPAFYLRPYTDPACPPSYEPYLWVVDLDDGSIRRRAPENTAALTDYYALGEGSERQAVEAYLSSVESQAAPVIDKILRGLLDGETLSPADKSSLSRYIALQIVRVPGFRNRLEEFVTGIGRTVGDLMLLSPERYESELRAAHPEREFTAAEIDAEYKAARGSLEGIIANPSAVLGHALAVVPQIADLLRDMSGRS